MINHSRGAKHLFHFLCVLMSTLTVSVIYWWLYGKPTIGIDDANIYFVYLENFVQGKGFVYNPGGDRVEGFTSLLWVLACSLLYVCFQNFEIALLFVNVIIVSSALYIAIRFLNQLNYKSTFLNPLSIVYFLMITLIPGYIDWTVLTLMETGIWSLLIISIVVNIDTRSRTSLPPGHLSYPS